MLARSTDPFTIKPTVWADNAQPVGMSLDQLLYRVRQHDTEGLIFDAVSLDDFLEDAETLVLDALTTTQAKLERQVRIIERVLKTAGSTLNVVASQVSDPFKRQGVINVAAIFELSDGQTISIVFHNPDATNVKSLKAGDTLIAWKWLLNKRDITIVAAPEKGADQSVRQIAARVMKLAEKNSAAFARINRQRAERMDRIDGLRTEIAELETQLTGLQKDIEVAKVEKEERDHELAQRPTRALSALERIKGFLGLSQYRSMTEALSARETAASEADKALALAELIDTMATRLQQEDKGTEATAYLRYQQGSSEHYIIEKDNSGDGTEGARGWIEAIRDIGDVNISNIVNGGGTLDVDFRPAVLSSVVDVAEPIDPTRPEEYAKLLEQGEEALAKHQDQLDGFFQQRLIDIRNALRELGWSGEQMGELSKGDYTLDPQFKKAGAGSNVVGVNYKVTGLDQFFMSDDLSRSATELAEKIDLGVRSAQPESEPQPEPQQEGDSERLPTSAELTDAFESYLADADDNHFVAANATYKEILQGRVIPTVIGGVHLTGNGFKEIKRGMKSDALKAKLTPFIPAILKDGKYDGKSDSNKDRSDFVAFHFFYKEIDLGDVLVTAGVNVGERADGMFLLTAYGLGHSLQRSWQKRANAMDTAQTQKETLADSPGYEPGTHEGFGQDGAYATLDSSLDQDGGSVNIFILKVVDKATGKRLTDMEDASETDTLTPEGAENLVKTAKGTQVMTGFTVVEADSLIASHDAQGNPNPAYPEELQPRDRSRDSSTAWVRKTAQQLDPDSLGRTRRADSGAPIVGPDGVVESGNGRTMAIQEAYRSSNADEYRQWLIEEAETYKLSAEKIRSMKAPVLVRVRTSDIDRRTFAVEANQDDKLAMTGTEKAKADADRLDDGLLAKLSDDGDLLSAANRSFLMGFMQSLGDTEAAQYMTSDGKPTGALVQRVQSALFAKAYADDRLLELTADASKPEIANIVTALNIAAPEFVRARAADAAGADALSEKVADSVELSLNDQAVQSIIEATNLVRKARSEGQSIEEVVAQKGLFEDIDPTVAAMAVFISKNNRSGKRLGVAFKAMAEYVRKEAERGQTVDMFGDAQQTSLADIIAAANRELDRLYGEGEFAIDVPDLFSSGGPEPEPEPEPGPETDPQPEPVPEPEPEPGPQPEPEPQPEPTPDLENQADRDFLQSVIDGTVADILSAELGEQLMELYERHGGEDAEWADAELKAMAEAAMDAYEQAMMAQPMPTV